MTEEELASIEAEHIARTARLVAEVRRLRGQVKFHGGDPDVTLTIKHTIGHGSYVAMHIVEQS